MLWLRYAALPHIDRYRDDIFSSIEKSSGMAVSARHIHGGWEGLRPHVYLDGLRIRDKGGKLALGLERAEASLSWWALLAGQVRLHDVDFHRPELVLRRGADGIIYLADKPLNAPGPADHAFSDWLLAQRRVGVHDAVLVWRDEMGGAPEVRLTGVQIAVRKHLGGHRAAISARPPRELAARVEARADLELRREEGRWQARGEIYAEALNANLAVLRAHLPVPDTLRDGAGSLRVWTTLAPRGATEIVADLDMRDAKAQFASDATPLELAHVAGRLRYRVAPEGFTLSTEGLRLRLPEGAEARPGNFSLSRVAPAGQAPRVEVRADGIDVKLAATLLEYFPVPRELRTQVPRFAPRGRIADAAFSWTGEDARQAKAYSLKGRFEDVGVNAVDAMPGVSGMSGRIEGTQAGGTVQVDSRNVAFEMGRFFRAPLRFDTVAARASWKHAGDALEVAIEEARFANAHTEGRMAGTWRSLPGAKERTPGFVDLKGKLTRADPTRIAHYMPNDLATTRDWLERSIEAGAGANVDFEVKGDLWHFPFGEGHEGHFLVQGELAEARLKYHRDWPAVDGINGTFRFENRRMEIRADRARIFASRASPVSAIIDDFAANPPVLRIDAAIDTTGADTFRFLRESPLVDGPGAFTRAVAVEGPGNLKLRLAYPLWGVDPVRVAGDYQFNGATATVGPNLAMRDVRGRLSFTEKGVRAQEVRGSLFEQPATLSMASLPDGQVLTTLDGRIAAPAMAAYTPAHIAAKLEGAAAWSARVLSGRQGTELTVTSDLTGLGVALPEPFAKAPAQPRALTMAIARLGTPNEVITVALAGGVFGRFARASAGGAEGWQGALRFGSPVTQEPARDGLWLYGDLASLDVDAWQAAFAAPHPGASPQSAPAPQAAAPGIELRGVDLRLARARYLSRDFAQMHAQLQRTEGEWSGKLESPRVAGEVRWNPRGKGKLVARLDRLTLTDPAVAATPGEKAQPADELPALDVAAEHFEFRGRWLGRLDLKAEPAGDEWRIERLDIVNGHAQFKSSGVWRRTGAGSLTTLALKLDSDNLNALFAQFGFGDYLKRGNGSLDGNLAWTGYPYEFALPALAGTLKVEARRGQFAKIDTGAGKLLGLLSLQSLPRRAMFDFRDIFNEGFAFERIQGDVKVARGVLLVDEFEISGPAAFVSLTGEVSLPQETQSLTMHVVPEVSEGLALAATVFGTPVLGLSTLLLSKLLRNPLGKAVSYEYQVTGSWDNPHVTRLSAPPARAAVPAPPGPAAAAKASTSP